MKKYTRQSKITIHVTYEGLVYTYMRVNTKYEEKVAVYQLSFIKVINNILIYAPTFSLLICEVDKKGTFVIRI